MSKTNDWEKEYKEKFYRQNNCFRNVNGFEHVKAFIHEELANERKRVIEEIRDTWLKVAEHDNDNEDIDRLLKELEKGGEK